MNVCAAGALKLLPDISGGSETRAVMSGVSAASRLSEAMHSMNPTTHGGVLTQLPGTQSQHQVEERQEQHQSADGTSSSMSAARCVPLL